MEKRKAALLLLSSLAQQVSELMVHVDILRKKKTEGKPLKVRELECASVLGQINVKLLGCLSHVRSWKGGRQSTPSSSPAIPTSQKKSNVSSRGGAPKGGAASSDNIQKELLPIFNEEMIDLIPAIDELMDEVKAGNTSPDIFLPLHRLLHTLKGSTGMIGALRVRSIIHTLEGLMEGVEAGSKDPKDVSPIFIDQYEEAKNYILAIQREDWDWSPHRMTPDLQLNDFHFSTEGREKSATGGDFFESEVEKALSQQDVVQIEVLSMFLEESDDLIPQIDDLMASLASGNAEPENIHALHRHLHTLKGSSGMAGLSRVRSLVHVMESIMESTENGFKKPADILGTLALRYELVKSIIDAAREGRFNEPVRPLTPLINSPDVNVELISKKIASVPEGLVGPKTIDKKFGQIKKVVRVDSALMDLMVTESNEALLARSGLSSTVDQYRSVTRSLEENIKYLVGVARELELHAETQIQSQKTQMEESGDDFDPLEFDRFTRLHELARFLTEGTGDTFELHQSLNRLSFEQESLLAYQERPLREVRENLSRTRLVHFDSTATRFKKIVDQTAKEVGKRVNLRITGGRTEIDSTVLEKIVSPMEHALRNSLAHGIEPEEERRRAGKNPIGEISIDVIQKSGRIIISVQDDGGGVRVDKVRQKAVTTGMWKADAPMTPEQASELICLPSFSTADSVSQIAGRGVGMDVVRNDIMALGGRFHLKSETGRGLKITIFLPMAVSTASAILVETSGERFFLSTEAIENVILLTREETLRAFESGKLSTKIAGVAREIDFFALGDLYRIPTYQRRPNEIKPHSQVIIMQEEDFYVAIWVNRLIGEFEISIKPLGKSLVSIVGLNGTTILSDGTAVFVANPAATLADRQRRKGSTLKNFLTKIPEPIFEEGGVKQLLVMVVDDSLTVRKTTARFLQRVGFSSILAKDGLNAIDQLAVSMPDLILLDVEMPRMDGFEFAKYVRASATHKKIPIIMITSRTAPKHRARALGIGINEYIGKPYQEENLLELIKKYTEKENISVQTSV